MVVVNRVKIKTEFITLGQFLKVADIVSSGGMAKAILQEYTIYVNDLQESRRGKKLYPGDKVHIKGLGDYRVEK